jgi:purine-binding chemotaxis protein CheW
VAGTEQELAQQRSAARVLVFRARNRLCALPLSSVVETMRPLPIEPVEGAPPFLAGVSVIRGAPVPVVDGGSLLDAGAASPTRLIILRTGDRRVALRVDEVIGIRMLPAGSLQDLPPLLQDARREAVEAIGTLDAEFLVVLSGSRLVPDSVWADLESRERPQ